MPYTSTISCKNMKYFSSARFSFEGVEDLYRCLIYWLNYLSSKLSSFPLSSSRNFSLSPIKFSWFLRNERSISTKNSWPSCSSTHSNRPLYFFGFTVLLSGSPSSSGSALSNIRASELSSPRFLAYWFILAYC